MPDLSTLSALVSDANLVDGNTIDAAEHNTHRTTREDRINDLLSVALDLQKSYAGSSEPTDKPVGKHYMDTGGGVDQMKFYAAAGLMTVATTTQTQTLTNKTLLAAANILDARLEDVAGLTASDGGFIVGDGSNFVVESGATARTSLGLAIGTDVQAYSAHLATIAALARTDGNFIVGDGSAWVAESGATARTSLGLGSGDSPAFAGLTITGTAIGPSGTWDSGGMDLASGDTYAINGTDVLSATTLGSGVTASSLTSVGTLSALTVGGAASLGALTLTSRIAGAEGATGTDGTQAVGSIAILKCNKGGSSLDVQGFSGGVVGQLLFVQNVNGTDSVTIRHQSGSASATNQINCIGGVDKTIPPYGGMIFYYDSAKWHCLGANLV